MLEKFDCTKNYVLEDDRVLLRPLQQEDNNSSVAIFIK